MTKVPESASIAKLSTLDSGLGETYAKLADQIKKHDKHQADMRAGFKIACGTPLRITGAQRAVEILSDCSLRIPNLSWLPETLGPMLGYLTSDEVERMARLERPDEKTRQLSTSSYVHMPATVPGACVVPLWSAPNVPSGMYVFYHQGRKLHERSIEFRYNSNTDIGIAIHPALLRAESPVLLAPSIRYLVRMAVEHTRAYSSPPPIAALPRLGASTSLSLNWLGGRRVSMWTPKLVPEQLRQAIRMNCPIHICGPKTLSDVDMNKYIQARSTKDLIAECHDKALPWPTVLAQTLRGQAADEAILYLQQCNLSGTEIHLLESELSPSQKGLTRQALDTTWQHTIIPVDRGRVEQNVKGWYFRGDKSKPVCITDAPFRIQTIYSGHRSARCEIEVAHNGDRFDLTFDLAEFRKSPMALVQKFMLMKHLRHTTFDPAWEKRVIHVSSQLSPPTTVSELRACGFDPQSNLFRTAHYSLDVVSGQLRPIDGDNCGKFLPEAKDRPLTTRELSTINFEHKTLWPILATAAQLYTNITGQRPVQLVISDRSAVRHMRKLADRIGINLTEQSAVDFDAPKVKLLKEQYPTLRLFRSEDIDWAYPMWLAASEDVADWLTMTSHVLCISDRYSRVPLPTAQGAQTAVLQILREMCRRGEQQTRPALGAAAAAWQLICQRGGKESCIKPDQVPASTSAQGLQRLLQRHLDNGYISVVGECKTNLEQPYIAHPAKSKHLFIPRHIVARLFERLNLPSWDIEQLILDLSKHEDFGGVSGRYIRPYWQMRKRFLRIERESDKLMA